MKTDADRPVLVDTHCWIWQQAGRKDLLPAGTLKEMESAAAAGRLLLSAMSIWELGMLESKGRIELTLPCEQWVQEALATPGLTLVPLTPEIAVHSTRLPGNFHSDRVNFHFSQARIESAKEKFANCRRASHWRTIRPQHDCIGDV